MSMKKRWIATVSGGLVLCLLIGICGRYGECQGIRENVLRLHILANSDSTEDQALKLRVRDAVVEAAAGLTDGAMDEDAARAAAEAHLPRLRQAAEEVLRAAGSDQAVGIEVCRMYFTTRQYDDVTLPAGMYDAVRITLGAGAGHNWWCVVYPPLCLGSATGRDQLDKMLGKSQRELVKGGSRYTVRFKMVEWIEWFFSRWR